MRQIEGYIFIGEASPDLMHLFGKSRDGLWDNFQINGMTPYACKKDAVKAAKAYLKHMYDTNKVHINEL